MLDSAEQRSQHPVVGQDTAMTTKASDGISRADAAFGRRLAAAEDLVGHAPDIVSAAFAMAERFHRGGKLVTFGVGLASTDAQHVAVEFVHPVIVGKRALPAIALTSDVATVTAIAVADGLSEIFARQIEKLTKPGDIALGISVTGDPCVPAGLRAATSAGLLTIALTGRDAQLAADHVLAVRSADPRVIKEIQVSIYHLLWELVHVFLEQPAVFEGMA